MEPISGRHWWCNQFDSRFKVISSWFLIDRNFIVTDDSSEIFLVEPFFEKFELDDQFNRPKFVNQTLDIIRIRYLDV